MSATASASPLGPNVELHNDYMAVSLDLEGQTLALVRDGAGYSVELAGAPTQPKPGFPKVPVVRFFLAIPPDTSAEIADIDIGERMELGRFKLSTVPKPVLGVEGGMTVIEGFSRCVSPEFAACDTWPSVPVEIEMVGFMRGLKVARIAVYPVSVERSRERVFFTPQVSFKLSLKPTHESGGRGAHAPSKAEKRFLKSIVSNLDMAGTWFTKPAKAEGYIDYEDMCKVVVEDEGLYALDRSDMVERCGFPSGLDPRKLALYNGGEAVDILVTGEDDGRLDSRDLLVFWAEGYEDVYTDKNAYILALTNDDGPRTSSRSAAPDPMTRLSEYFTKEVLVKRDRFYFESIPGFVEDHWFAEYMIAPADIAVSFSLSKVNFDAGAQAELLSSLYGASYTGDGTWDHHAVILINDTVVDEAFWNGQQVAEVETYIDTSLFNEGENWVSVQLPNDTGSSLDVVCPDYFFVSHPAKYDLSSEQLKVENPEGADEGRLRFKVWDDKENEILVFDITDPRHPVLLEDVEIHPAKSGYEIEFESDVDEGTGFVVAAVESLTSPETVQPLSGTWLYHDDGAEYVIVVHDPLHDAAEQLADFSRGCGLDVEVVKYSEIIDAFNFGLYGPLAIKRFLGFVYLGWNSVPAHVLLVGDASYDYKNNYVDWGLNDHLSTLLVDDPALGDVASDLLLACVDGDDHLPEFAIARLPAHTPDEVLAYLDKLEHYYDSGDNFWRKDFLFVADDGFESMSEGLQQYVSSSYRTSQLFISDYGDVEQLTADLMDAMNRGVVWLDYTGHGGVDVWAHEHILDYEMITEGLNNEDRYSFVPVWTCLNGYFDHALINEVIAEGFTLTEGAGSIGMFAPTRVSMGLAGDVLSEAFYSTVFDGGERNLGIAATAACSLAIDDGLGIWAESYVLFGDPTVDLALPIPEDVNGSGRVDGVDLIYLCRNMDGSESEFAKYADIDLDGEVTEDDLDRLGGAFGTRVF